jgi:hypothetical protein
MFSARIFFLYFLSSMVLFSIGQESRKIITESHNKTDTRENEYLKAKLKPIRENFRRINSITKWSSIITKDNNESTEGGEIKFYYLDVGLQKVIASQFGETFQYLQECYLLDGQLSFVVEKSYKYNRSIYYDSASMKENKDTATFAFDKSVITQIRSYFQYDKLIHQIKSQYSGSPFSNEYLFREQKRIKSEFAKFLKSR